MAKKSISKKIVMQHAKGLHARVAAMIVQKAEELQKKYNVEFKVKKGAYKEVPLNSILLLISMKIKAKEEFEMLTEGEGAEEASILMAEYLGGDFELDQNAVGDIDSILQDNILTAENIFDSIANGLIVINENNIVTFFNKEAERIFDVPADRIAGRDIRDVFPDSILPEIVQTKKTEIGYTQNIGDYTVVTNSSPLLVENQIRGAVSIFEDVSMLTNVSWQLKEIKELKEKYQLILESVQDGICFFDNNGEITYVNAAYCKIIDKKAKELIGVNVRELSPEGDRVKVLEHGKAVRGGISKKENGVTVVSNVNPLIVDEQIMGGISIIKDITEVQTLMEKLSKASAKADYLQEELIRVKKLGPAFENIKGVSGKLYDCMTTAAKAATSKYTVLIRGESGTGKELIAEAIHYSSSRASEPFVRVNCGAIPPTLIESELFGHEKGSFTGAYKTKLGRFELADKGTIFLDEIGELDKSMQVKLLRVVQSKEFQRVGGEKNIKVDVRIVAATNQDLEQMVKNGEFREDLYYRLNVIPIWLPPLRDRREDIPILAEHFCERISEDLGKDKIMFEKEALRALKNYTWPGNIRELENVMERTMILMEGNVVRAENIPMYILDNQRQIETDDFECIVEKEVDMLSWEEYEKIVIEKALEKYKSFNAAGKVLGLTHNTVAAKARKFNLCK